jgi:hypothetical protein
MPVLTDEQYRAIENNTSALALSIDATAINWRAVGEDDPLDRLLATVLIGGSFHHLEAREITEDEDDGISFVSYPEDYDTLRELAGGRPSSTVSIEGRDYILFMTPYCA